MQEVLMTVPNHVAFIRRDGTRLASLQELIDALYVMSEDEFRAHVTDSKNDFASWIEHVFVIKSLATQVKSTTNRYEMIQMLEWELAKAKGNGNFFVRNGIFSKKEPNKQLTYDGKKGRVTVTGDEKPAEKSKLALHEQIHHLDKHLAHMTKHHEHTSAKKNVGESSMEQSITSAILDFTLGLIVGLMLGFILARSFGFFA